MKNLIRKILKESEDEFEWARGMDVDAAEKEVRKPFRDIDYEYSDGFVDEVYPALIEYGVTKPEHLTTIGRLLYRKTSRVFDRGYESGQDDCSCDYCCDDMYYIDDVREKEREARDEGREDGYEDGYRDGKSEMENKIEELEEQIAELQSRLAGSDDDLT